MSAERPDAEGMSLEEGIRSRLETMLGDVVFTDLQAHLERDAVFIVAAELSIVDCGVSIAMDDASAVATWIESGKLRKPSVTERENWPHAEGRAWRALVVQPFVLVQDPGQ